MTRLAAALVVALLPGVVLAQAPDDEWAPLPSTSTTPPPELPPPPVGPPPPPPPSFEPSRPRQVYSPPPRGAPLQPRPEVLQRVRGPQDRNAVSMLGATSLGQWNRGQLFSLGFPLFSLRFLIGLGERFDLGVAYDSQYFQMHEPRLVARLGLYQGPSVAFAASLEAGYAFFTTRASREVRGPRWLTGRRNVNVSPALHLSFMGPQARSARVFFEARYTLALDTEPYATDPLVGVPAAVVPGHNVGVTGGAELPLTAKTSFFFSLGLEIHGRAIDVPLMPNVSVGLVTSL